MGGGGSPYNEFSLKQSWYEMQGLIQSSKTEADAKIAGDWQMANAEIQSATITAQADMYVADQNKETQLEALRVREKEAVLQYKTDKKMADAEMIRAESMSQKVQVDSQEINLEHERESRELDQEEEEFDARFSRGDGSTYWYG